MASSLNKPASNLCDTSGIKFFKCKGDMELVNVSDKYIASLQCKTKKIKNLDEVVLKMTLTTLSDIEIVMKNVG